MSKCPRHKIIILAILFFVVVFAGAVEPKENNREEIEKKIDKISVNLALEVFLQNKEDYRDKICATIDEYKKIIKQYPECVKAYSSLGEAYGYLEENKKAIKNFKKAIKIDPEFIYAHEHLGLCYYKIGQNLRKQKKYKEARKKFILARKEYEIIHEIKPNRKLSIDFPKIISETLTNLKEDEKWENDRKKQKQIDKYWDLAMEASDREDYGRAIKYLKKIEKIEPNYNKGIYWNIADEYTYWGKYKKAIEFYKKQISLNPQEKTPLLYSRFGLMKIYYKLGEFGKAKQKGTLALKLDPENKMVKRYLKKIEKAEKQK